LIGRPRPDRTFHSTARRFIGAAMFGHLVGCADLNNVTNKELLDVDPKLERRLTRRVPATPIDSPIHPIREIHSTLAPTSALNDGRLDTSATAPDSTALVQYVMIDLGATRNCGAVSMLSSSVDVRPRKIRIDVAGDRGFPFEPIYVGRPGSNPARFRSTKCRFLRITALEVDGEPWSIAELTVQ
jgi:hypothetical protein